MNKKIIIGCILILTLLLVMPSIPAIHINSIENEIKKEIDIVTLFDKLDFKPLDKFPLLFYFILAIGYFRIYRCNILWDISIEEGYWPGEIIIKHPLLLIRSLIIGRRADRWIVGWEIISDILGLDWDLDF
jgi:hypothetical protein